MVSEKYYLENRAYISGWMHRGYAFPHEGIQRHLEKQHPFWTNLLKEHGVHVDHDNHFVAVGEPMLPTITAAYEKNAFQYKLLSPSDLPGWF